jgi:hypothetical protein
MRKQGWLRLIIGMVFLLFALVQLNDPDPWGWVALYGGVGILLMVSAWRSVPRWLAGLGLAVVVIWLAALLPEFINWLRMGMPTITGSMKAEAPHIEYTREFLGLALCGAALAWLAWKKD